MDSRVTDFLERPREVMALTKSWGPWDDVSLYLDRCQVDTPDDLVKATWSHVYERRKSVGLVLDFGAGDGRFARHGVFGAYRGYEIDAGRCQAAEMPDHAQLINCCAFEQDQTEADLCIGNPPFVRNQDLPTGWRQHASDVLFRRTGVHVSGLANAWQYFFLLSLASCKADGLCALVVPYEWVSRPSAKALRNYVRNNGWSVSVYRLVDTTFDSVLTTSSITIVDKADLSGTWRYFEETADGAFAELQSESGAKGGVLPYLRRSEVAKTAPRAVRGLSPGTQKVLTLTEAERARFGLVIKEDVVPCVTSMRTIAGDIVSLDEATFQSAYRDAGQKCWLIRTDREPRRHLAAYLDAVTVADRATATCLERDIWWKFNMPPVPDLLMLQCFRESFPKVVRNVIKARAVGGVCGLYNIDDALAERLVGGFEGLDLRQRVVAHSHGLRKIEINQINALLAAAGGGSTI